MSNQMKFEIALARAEQRSRHTDFDQHIIEENGEFIVLDDGDGTLPQWRIDQIVFTVSGKLCLDELGQENWLNDELPIQIEMGWLEHFNESELPY